MRRFYFICVLLFSFAISNGQEHIFASKERLNNIHDILALYIDSSNQNNENINNKVDKLIAKLEKAKTRRKSDYSFLRALFYKTHNSILKDYDRLASMGETLEKGSFGCVTGTAIYALLLEHFGYEYKVIELPNHVFIHLELDNASYIFESTLAFDGFRRSNEALDKILKQRWINNRRITSLETVGGWYDEFKVLPGNYTKISITELAGLQYFNESVIKYLEKDYPYALELAMKGYELYESERHEKLMQLIIHKILKNKELKVQTKEGFVNRYVQFVKTKKLSQTK